MQSPMRSTARRTAWNAPTADNWLGLSDSSRTHAQLAPADRDHPPTLSANTSIGNEEGRHPSGRRNQIAQICTVAALLKADCVAVQNGGSERSAQCCCGRRS